MHHNSRDRRLSAATHQRHDLSSGTRRTPRGVSALRCQLRGVEGCPARGHAARPRRHPHDGNRRHTVRRPAPDATRPRGSIAANQQGGHGQTVPLQPSRRVHQPALFSRGAFAVNGHERVSHARLDSAPHAGLRCAARARTRNKGGRAGNRHGPRRRAVAGLAAGRGGHLLARGDRQPLPPRRWSFVCAVSRAHATYPLPPATTPGDQLGVSLRGADRGPLWMERHAWRSSRRAFRARDWPASRTS